MASLPGVYRTAVGYCGGVKPNPSYRKVCNDATFGDYAESVTVDFDPSVISYEGILDGFPAEFIAGRYHSLYAVSEKLPDCFRVLARTEDGVIMAIEHRELPLAAVQFHPESILTLKDDLGLRLIARVIGRLAR